MKSHLPEIRKLYPKKAPRKSGFPALIQKAYQVYTDRTVFVGVLLAMYFYHLVTLNVAPTFQELLWQLPAITLGTYGIHNKLEGFLNRRQHVLMQSCLLVLLLWFKFGLASSLAFEFEVVFFAVGSTWLVIWLWGLYVGSHKAPEAIYLRGARTYSPQVVFQKLQAINNKLIAKGVKPEYVNFAGMPLLSIIATTGFALFGETRTGKSVLITAILAFLKYPNKNAVIFDASNNVLSKLLAMAINRDRIINLNPFHTDCYEWNFGATFTNPASTRVFFTNVMRSAKADNASKGGDASSNFFEVEAAGLATLVVETLRRSAIVAPNFGLKELCYICTNKKRLIATLQTYPDIWEEVEEIIGEADQNLAVFSTLKQVFTGLKPMAECYYRARMLGRSYDLADFHQSDNILVLGREDNLGGCYLNHWNGAIIQYIITTIIGKPTTDDTKPARTLFVVDEFDMLGKIDSLPSISTQGGKYATCLVIGTQSCPTIASIYGESKATQILSSITHTAFLRLGEAASDKYASEYFGQQTIKDPTYTLAEDGSAKTIIKPLRKSTSWVEKTKPLFELGHFRNQPKIGTDGVMGVTIDCDGYYYQAQLTGADIGHFSPPRPTPDMERENNKPQDEETLHFKPLSDGDLLSLGLTSLLKQNQPSAQRSPASDGTETLTLSLDDIQFED